MFCLQRCFWVRGLYFAAVTLCVDVLPGCCNCRGSGADEPKLDAAGVVAIMTGAVTCAVHIPDVLDELMPVPVDIDRRTGLVEISWLRNPKVVRSSVPGAPAAAEAPFAEVVEVYFCGG